MQNINELIDEKALNILKNLTFLCPPTAKTPSIVVTSLCHDLYH